MHVISRKKLNDYGIGHADVKDNLDAWFHEVKNADWSTPADLKARFPSADILPGDRIVFNIKGNRYRLVVRINWSSGTVFLRFIGTHSEYDKIDAETI